MPTVSDNYAIERSTYALTVGFADPDDTPITPTSIKWTLTDADGTVINGRDAVTVSTLASSVNVILSGDDLQILPSESARALAVRTFTVEAEYLYGAQTLPLNDSIIFYIKNLKAIE